MRHLYFSISITDCTLELFRQDGAKTEFGPYLDLDQTLDEQREDIETFTEGYKWSIVLRTQLSVRVHVCIDKYKTQFFYFRKYIFCYR